MSPRLEVQFSRRAMREIRAASEWWDANRPAAPDAFRDSIEKALLLITTQPEIGAVATNTRLRKARRIHLSRIRYFLYYRVTGTPRRVEVVALWHTSRYPEPGL